jgi:hypothetical protein
MEARRDEEGLDAAHAAQTLRGRLVIEAGVEATRVNRARRESEGLGQLQARLGLDPGAPAVALYLTSLADAGETGRAIRHRVASLDLAERLEGRSPWSQHPDIAPLLRGLYRTAELGPVRPRVDPLQRELLQVVVRSLCEPTPTQRLEAAAIALANQAALSKTALAHLRWVDLTIKPDHLIVRVPPAPGNRWNGLVAGKPMLVEAAADRRICPVALLRQARLVTGATGLIFGNTGGPGDFESLRQWLSPLPIPRHGSWVRERLDDRSLLGAIENALALGPAQVRNRALLLMGFGAALRVQEAVHLDQGDVNVHRDGLVLSLLGRRNEVALLRDRRPEFCPVQAWEAWRDFLARAGMIDADRAAFVRLRGRALVDHRLSREGLSRAVRIPCVEAGLRGNYGFLSLRTGFIRTSVRDDYPVYRIAAQAGLNTLNSVVRHGRREQILRENVAAQLGL